MAEATQALAFLQPGVIQFNSASKGRTALVANGSGRENVRRGHARGFPVVLLDGTDIHDHAGFTPGSVAGNNLGVDAILEFRVLTHNYSAEYGRTAGGVVSAVTRSGTNALHGSAFAFYRDDALDAREFFDQGGTKPFRRNQFGAAVGGPIRRGRTFFFGAYEGLRQQRSETLPRTVPTAAARQGFLPGRTVNVSPLIRPYLELFPLPNGRDFGDGTAEFLWVASTDTSEDFASVRIDHQLSDRQYLFGRLTMDDTRSVHPGSVPPFEIDVDSRNAYVTLEHKAILSHRMVNVFRSAFNRTDPIVADSTDVDDALRIVPERTWLLTFQQAFRNRSPERRPNTLPPEHFPVHRRSGHPARGALRYAWASTSSASRTTTRPASTRRRTVSRICRAPAGRTEPVPGGHARFGGRRRRLPPVADRLLLSG